LHWVAKNVKGNGGMPDCPQGVEPEAEKKKLRRRGGEGEWSKKNEKPAEVGGKY